MGDKLSIQEAAKELGVSRVTLWRYIRQGKLSAIQYSSRKTLIRREELERFMRDSEK